MQSKEACACARVRACARAMLPILYIKFNSTFDLHAEECAHADPRPILHQLLPWHRGKRKSRGTLKHNGAAKQHYEEWYGGAAEPAGGWVAVDSRGPNGDGDGKGKGRFKGCAAFP